MMGRDYLTRIAERAREYARKCKGRIREDSRRVAYLQGRIEEREDMLDAYCRATCGIERKQCLFNCGGCNGYDRLIKEIGG